MIYNSKMIYNSGNIQQWHNIEQWNNIQQWHNIHQWNDIQQEQWEWIVRIHVGVSLVDCTTILLQSKSRRRGRQAWGREADQTEPGSCTHQSLPLGHSAVSQWVSVASAQGEEGGVCNFSCWLALHSTPLDLTFTTTTSNKTLTITSSSSFAGVVSTLLKQLCN